MTAPSHHLPEALLVEYVAGTTAEPVSLAIACHTTLCGGCQIRVRELDRVAGAVLASTEPAAMAPDALQQMLARLDGDRADHGGAASASAAAPEAAPMSREPPTGQASDPRLPRPLLRYLGEPSAWRWKRVVPGIYQMKIASASREATARLVKLRPGAEIPLHSHAGAEYTVIFTGALEDGGMRYGRGDVAIRHAGERHDQRVSAGETCIALVVNHGDLIPLTWKGRILRLLDRT